MLTLTPELSTGNADIDGHHAEFVSALNAIDSASGAQLVAALDRLVAHCEAHFEFENAQMQASHFPPIGCHAGEHDMVLETVRAVRARAAAGHLEIAQTLGPALAEWFENHVQSMDAVLARYLAQPPGQYAAAQVVGDADGVATGCSPAACGVPVGTAQGLTA